MKILTTVRRVPDLDARFGLSADKTRVDTEALDHKVNPFDEIGVEEAIRLKEKGGVDEIVAVCIGSSEATKELRTALAMGADRAILVEADEQEIDTYVVAAVLKALVEKESPDLVLMGKLGVDYENNQVGQLLAGMLDWPQATFAYSTELSGNTLTVGREVDGGTVVYRLPLPAVVTADLRLNEPRFPSLPGIMKAKRKPLDTIALSELVEASPRVKSVRFELPPERQAGIMVETIDQLVGKLKEAKVL